MRDNEFRAGKVVGVHSLKEFFGLQLRGVAECYLVVYAARADERLVEFLGVVGGHY